MRTIRASITRAGAATLLAVLALAGCSEEEPTAPDQSTEDTATSSAPDDASMTSGADDTAGQTDEAAQTDQASSTEEPPVELAATDDAFTISIPATWEDVTDQVEEETVLLAAKESERIDSFFTNVVVTQEEYVGNLTSAVENTAEELAGEDGEYELLEPSEVDGNSAPGYTLVREVQDTTVHQTQRWISHDGTLYVVTLSAVESQAETAGAALDDILASWTWAD